MPEREIDTQNVIDQAEVMRPKMVTVEIDAKTYEVTEGITVIRSLL